MPEVAPGVYEWDETTRLKIRSIHAAYETFFEGAPWAAKREVAFEPAWSCETEDGPACDGPRWSAKAEDGTPFSATTLYDLAESILLHEDRIKPERNCSADESDPFADE